MKLENQVCSLELSKRLKELGVRQESAFYWSTNTVPSLKDDVHLREKKVCNHRDGKVADGGVIRYFSAFTVAELGEMLPNRVKGFGLLIDKYDPTQINEKVQRPFMWGVAYVEWGYDGPENRFEIDDEESEANARAKMLIYLLQNKIISVEDVNRRFSE